MTASIDKAIDVMAKKVTDELKPDEALKFTQSLLNLAHAKATIIGAEKLDKS